MERPSAFGDGLGGLELELEVEWVELLGSTCKLPGSVLIDIRWPATGDRAFGPYRSDGLHVHQDGPSRSFCEPDGGKFT